MKLGGMAMSQKRIESERSSHMKKLEREANRPGTKGKQKFGSEDVTFSGKPSKPGKLK
jgi:hypothetical protein